MEIINNASEKFKGFQDEICSTLFELLRKITALENEISARDEELEEKSPDPHQFTPEMEQLWSEYRKRLGDILKPACSEKLLKRGYGQSFSDPAKYACIDGDCKAYFIMKSAKKAVVEIHVQGIGQVNHKIVLKNIDGKWLVDETYYGFESDPDKWLIDPAIR